ncbi:MAG: hypothetical protein KDD33_09040 [Bdellovibrionales bacterium]|nr:hypothetical protein [Bdellovibrionales bacterium]
MMAILKKILIGILCQLFIFPQWALAAQNRYSLAVSEASGKAAGAEYVSGNQPGTVLMKVNLWGAIQRPGIHHIPANTDLMTLISYAGGPQPQAKLSDVIIKRDTGKVRKRIDVDVQELISGVSHHQVALQPDDIVVIPSEKPLISTDTMAVVGLTSIIVSIVLAGVLIDRRTKQ